MGRTYYGDPYAILDSTLRPVVEDEVPAVYIALHATQASLAEARHQGLVEGRADAGVRLADRIGVEVVVISAINWSRPAA